jgi:hypothetical protein
MKKLTTLVLLLIAPLVIAQEKEIWACQQIVATGFDWNEGKWEVANFSVPNFLLERSIELPGTTLKWNTRMLKRQCWCAAQ